MRRHCADLICERLSSSCASSSSKGPYIPQLPQASDTPFCLFCVGAGSTISMISGLYNDIRNELDGFLASPTVVAALRGKDCESATMAGQPEWVDISDLVDAVSAELQACLPPMPTLHACSMSTSLEAAPSLLPSGWRDAA